MIKKGTQVQILSGKDKGKKGEVIEILRQFDKAKVKGINIIKKHEKRKRIKFFKIWLIKSWFLD